MRFAVPDPLTVVDAAYKRLGGSRFELGAGLGCPNQFEPSDGPLTDQALRLLVTDGPAART
jgi:hypothetical protein